MVVRQLSQELVMIGAGRRSFLARVIGGSIIGLGALFTVSTDAKAQYSTGRTDNDAGGNADRAGYGRTGITDNDSGGSADRAGYGRGHETATGSTDSDSGSAADRAGYGRGATASRVTDTDSGATADRAGYGRGALSDLRNRAITRSDEEVALSQVFAANASAAAQARDLSRALSRLPQYSAAGVQIERAANELEAVSVQQNLENVDRAMRDLQSVVQFYYVQIGDDAQLTNVDLQNVMQQIQQLLQVLVNVSKVNHDSMMGVIRNLR